MALVRSVLGSWVGVRCIFPPFLIPYRVPHGFAQDPNTASRLGAEPEGDTGADYGVEAAQGWDTWLGGMLSSLVGAGSDSSSGAPAAGARGPGLR